MAGGALVGLLLGRARPVTRVFVLSFIAGLGWSLGCRAIRAWFTDRVVRSLARLKDWWEKDSDTVGNAPKEICELAAGWPGVFWVKFHDRLGLSSLSASQIAAYDRFRSHVVWLIQFGPEYRALQSRVIHLGARPKSPYWLNNKLVFPLVLISIAGFVFYLLLASIPVPIPRFWTSMPRTLICLKPRSSWESSFLHLIPWSTRSKSRTKAAPPEPSIAAGISCRHRGWSCTSFGSSASVFRMSSPCGTWLGRQSEKVLIRSGKS